MAAKLVIPRGLAVRDAEDAVDHYASSAGEKAALGFIAALETVYGHLANHPTTGSPRYAHELGIAGLRSWPLKRYPYIVFYMEQASHIDVWRVLHGARDIPVWMRDSDVP